MDRRSIVGTIVDSDNDNEISKTEFYERRISSIAVAQHKLSYTISINSNIIYQNIWIEEVLLYTYYIDDKLMVIWRYHYFRIWLILLLERAPDNEIGERTKIIQQWII